MPNFFLIQAFLIKLNFIKKNILLELKPQNFLNLISN